MDIFPGPKLYLEQEPRCPTCAAILSAVTPVDTTPREASMPGTGDLTVCIYCATVLQFTEGLKLRVVTQDDRDEIQRSQPDVLRLLDEMLTMAKIRLQEERKTRKRWH